ncbi:HigA family addiction module antitoxin [Vibrio parahaemolyticus]|nr:HigA family addiction module antitoxin [Vibrio parahaemolyticus]
MRRTKRRPVGVGEMLKLEFLEPMEITSKTLADAMGVHRNTISNLINGGTLTAPLAIKLAAALGNTPEFWLNIQHAVDLWDTRNRYQDEAKLVKPLFSVQDTELRT